MTPIKAKWNFIQRMGKWLFVLLLITAFSDDVKKYANEDEEKVRPYTLPDPLRCQDGTVVTTDSLWWNKRRPETLKLFEQHIYGATPGYRADSLRFVVHKTTTDFLNRKAICKEVDVFFAPHRDVLYSMRILLVIPVERKKSPCFVGLNFAGNMTLSTDTFISMNTRWVNGDDYNDVVNNRATQKMRGMQVARWPLEYIIDQGFALATVYYGDLDPDFDDGFRNGIHPLFRDTAELRRKSAEWGSIGAWAWGLSRIADYLVTDTLIDPKNLIVVGHSRLGKAALWAGAQDTRFAMVVSNNSGCGGAALSKREFGENGIIINTVFPHWFCENFKQYNHNEDALPVDQHQLIALMAPRPVYVASAVNDLWADPKGEFLSALKADTVYKLLGTVGLPVKDMPAPNQPVMGRIGYHIRTGDHDITLYDWQQFILFAKKNLAN